LIPAGTGLRVFDRLYVTSKEAHDAAQARRDEIEEMEEMQEGIE